jgi:phosphatidylserine/phosphatidylglycerophosphate/cardiolipin synthase-like enzyme
MTPLFAALLLSVSVQAQTLGQVPPDLHFERKPPRRQPAPRPAPSPAPAGKVSFNGVDLPRFIFTARGGSPAGSIAQAIGAARRTVRVSLYSLSLPGATQALVDAKGRGLTVEVLFDYAHAYPKSAGSDGLAGPTAQLKQVLAAGIPVRLLQGGGPYGIMHNKFALLDGALLETGSFNWTTAAESSNHENAVFRDDAGLLADYQAYWDWMWAQGVPYGEGRAGKPSGTPPACATAVSANGRTFPACSFSPAGGTEAQVVAAIDSANGRVHVAMFSFTSDAVVRALIRAKDRGAEVLVALDRGQLAHETVGTTLRGAGVPVKVLTGPNGGGMLHDKFGVMDGLVELGSFNWTNNANANNFENALFSADAGDVAGYEAEFQALWSEGADSLDAAVAAAK